jgi:hypothetical protein
MKESYKEYLQNEFKSKVWDALEDVAFEFCDISTELNKECMEQAIEWFMIHFYNNED